MSVSPLAALGAAVCLLCALSAHAQSENATNDVTNDDTAVPAAAVADDAVPAGEPAPPAPLPPLSSTPADDAPEVLEPSRRPLSIKEAPALPSRACLPLMEQPTLAEARACLQRAHDDGDPAAAALLELVETAEPAPVASTVDLAFLTDGRGEAIVSSTGLFAFGGFLGAAVLFSALRTSESDSQPWLIAAPVVGGAAGFGLSLLGVPALRLDRHDVALTSSLAWVGGVSGALTSTLAFPQNNAVATVPLRLSLPALAGLAGLGIGIGLSRATAIDSGDVGLAHGVGIGSGLVAFFVLSAIGNAGTGIDARTGIFTVWGTGLVGYAAVLALHPLIDVERSATWLVEAGLVAGLLVGGAGLFVIAATGSTPGAVMAFSALGVTTAIGGAAGVAGASVASSTLRDLDLPVWLTPLVAADGRGQVTPGLALAGSLP